MKHTVTQTAPWGNVLWLESETVRMGIALEFGIRVVHLSCPGMENLCYTQPADLSDGFVTDGGWRLHGGHRIWMAPESDLTYAPDESPVEYTLTENGAIVTQALDPLLQIRKVLQIAFRGDGTVAVSNIIINAAETPITGAAWGVNTLDGGGVAEIDFPAHKGGCNPQRVVSLWGLTNLHDDRVQFTKTGLTATHKSANPDYFKVGLYCNPGRAVLTNKGQRFTLTFDAPPMEQLPDGGCNFELYLCSKFMELESLGVRHTLQPGEAMTHTEYWKLEKQ